MINVKINVYVDKDTMAELLVKELIQILGKDIELYCNNNEITVIWDSWINALQAPKKIEIHKNSRNTQEH